MSRILINDGNVAILAEKVIPAESTAARMKGLLGRSGLEPGTAMLIRPCRSIHMWFMRFPIDAAFLDAELRVLKVSRNLKPWQLAFAPRKTASVLEAAEGAMKNLQPGDSLILE
ncbi:DUF192 domain-containing protein [Pontiellaceae bacterium B12227]|nr:DUF192 domain-containing protein [Pontiellaceae bacterium B12227]